MTKRESARLTENGNEYQSTFFDRTRVRELLKKLKNNETLTNKQEFLKKYSDDLTQIEIIRDKLKRFPVLLSSAHIGYEKRGISRVSQFVYHVENYLAAVYLLDQRVKAYTSSLVRCAGRQRCPQADINSLSGAKDALITSIRPTVKIRGLHTHERTFEDKDIEEVVRYDKAGDFSKNLNERRILKKEAKRKLSVERKKWKAKIKNELDTCNVQVGALYEAADKLVWKIHRKMR